MSFFCTLLPEMPHGWHEMPDGLLVSSVHAIARHGEGGFPTSQEGQDLGDFSFYWTPPRGRALWPCVSVSPDIRPALMRVADWSARTGGHAGRVNWHHWKDDLPGKPGTLVACPNTTGSMPARWGVSLPSSAALDLSPGDDSSVAEQAARAYPVFFGTTPLQGARLSREAFPL